MTKSNINLPRTGKIILGVLIRSNNKDAFSGDIIEIYKTIAREESRFKA